MAFIPIKENFFYKNGMLDQRCDHMQGTWGELWLLLAYCGTKAYR